MKPDKHKKKNSLRYKKEHHVKGKEKETNKPGKPDIMKTGDIQRHDGTGTTKTPMAVRAVDVAAAIAAKSILIEKHHEEEKSYSRRKIESNWSRYEDFEVEQTEREEVRTASRGADFQTLVSQSGGAAAQLRMKDETWLDDDVNQDETDTEIDELFRVDFREVADRLLAVPLHKRLGIPSKYFEEDLLNLINKDAAKHAKRVQAMLDEEKAQKRKWRSKIYTTDTERIQTVGNISTSPDQEVATKSDVTVEESGDCVEKRLQDVHVGSCPHSNERDGHESTITDSEEGLSHEQRDKSDSQTSATDDSKSSGKSDSPGNCDVDASRSMSVGAKEAAASQEEKSKSKDPLAASQTEVVDDLEDWLDGCLSD